MPSSFSVGYSELLLASRLISAGRTEPWTFEVVAANCGARRSFLIATGLDQVLEILSSGAIADEDIQRLDQASSARKLSPPLVAAALEKVAKLRFSGDIFAVPEGTVLFADEPILRLRAPAPEAVIVGAAVLAALRAQTAVATKAARLKIVAGGKPLYELGPSAFTREGGLVAARAAYVGGLSATTHPLAACTWGIPVLPVVSLAQVSAMGNASGDLAACGLLLDGAAPSAYEAVLANAPAKPRALLADVTGSSEQTAHVLALRARMNGLGWSDVALIGTGDLDEARIEELAQASVPLDGFGIGASLLIGADATALSFEYELVERMVEGTRVACSRRDGGEGPRAVWRKRESGRFKGDTVQSERKAPPGGAPLLVPMMEQGKRLFRSPSVSEVRGLCEAQLSMLDPLVTRRVDPAIYPVLVVVDAPPRPATPKAPPAATPADAAGARAQRFNQLDDSADFTVMSNAFASVVAARLAEDAVDPVPEPARPPEEPAKEAELEAPAFEEIVETPEPALDASDHSFGELDRHVVKDLAPEPAKAESPAAPVVTAPPTDPLLAAAARLRSMQGGRASMSMSMSMPMTMPTPTATPAAPVEPMPRPAPAAANGKDPSSDPLLAAAARLKSMRKS